MKIEVNKTINFLDLENQYFRKLTYTDFVIPQFHSFTHRLLLIPINDINFNKEVNTIVQRTINNGYDKEIITKLINKKQKKLLLKQFYDTEIDKLYL